MATGGERRIYEGEDPVDEYLLNQLSKWIIYYGLPSLARDLEISDAEISRIMIPTRSAEEQIFKVGKHLFKKKKLKTKVDCGAKYMNVESISSDPPDMLLILLNFNSVFISRFCPLGIRGRTYWSEI